MPPRIETERFILTPEEFDDAPWLAELLTARGAGAVTPEQARERIAAMHALTREHGIGAYVLRPKDGGAPAGYVAITVGRGSGAEPELAYELLPWARGQGFATEAAQALVPAAFATGRRRLWSTIRPWNAASLRVLEKVGGFHQARVTGDAQGPVLWFVREAPTARPVAARRRRPPVVRA